MHEGTGGDNGQVKRVHGTSIGAKKYPGLRSPIEA